MNHQPFEHWLLAANDRSGAPLTPQEAAALKSHLHTCGSCQTLAAALRKVDHHLAGAPMLAPEPGFTSRWQARLEADLRRFHRRQSLAVLAFSLVGAALLLGSLVFLSLPLLQSPNVFFWTWVYRLFGLVSFADVAQDIFSALFAGLTGAIPLVWWFIILGVLSELGVLWIVSLRLLTNPRRVTK